LWKEATIVVLRKPGKDDYANPKSYRPIGLLSVFGKILEKMMIKRIRWHLLPRLNTRQYGFVPQRSTEDALYDLVQHIREGLKSKKINLVVSLDIEGAFDSAWWPAIKRRLAEEECPLNLRRIVSSYLENRKVCVRYADEEFCTATTKGCVQGSIGGPTFWNVLLDPLLDQISEGGVHCQAFADDIVLVFSGCSISKLEQQAVRVLNHVYEWGVSNKLKFAPHKTNAMVVTKKLKWDDPHIHMGSTEIKIVKEIKILGLLVDHKLNFNNHITEVCKKASNIYKPLARAAKIHWGLNSEIIRTIYVAVIEPIIMYASSVWAPATQKIMTQKQLNTVQRGFAQKICKSYRTVSLNAALVLAGLIPLDLRIQEAAQLFEAKRGKPQAILCGGKIERRVSFLKAPHPSGEAEVKFSSLEDMEPETVANHAMSVLRIFTDGSKMDQGVGAALTGWRDGKETLYKKFLLQSYCTVFQAELYALYQATKVALKAKEDSVIILSDSRSALEMLGRTEVFHPLAFAVRRNLTLLRKKGKIIRLFWVRAHVGVTGNERADYLAKEAVLKLKTRPNYDGCPLSYIKKNIRRETVVKWSARYKEAETASITKAFLPTVEHAHKILKKINLTPLLTQIFTGHGGFAGYLHRFKCKEDPGCVCDEGVEEDILHLLIDCPQHSRMRHDLHQQVTIDLGKGTLPALLEDKDNRAPFLKYCEKVLKAAIGRNRTR
ncbi:jg27143, partial [Pararge aegeria aegeria]